MTDPKTFYRELDSLLAKIGKDDSGKNFLVSILSELKQKFGDALRIHDGSIYEHRDKDFFLIYSSEKNHWLKKIPMNSIAVQHVLKNGSFIYDNMELGVHFVQNKDVLDVIPAAISISSPEQQWLLVFGLKYDWVREEITLFLNALRTAINYRLFSEIIGLELQQAVKIQKSLLPRTALKLEGYQVYGRSIPAELVGGDFYEYFEFEEGNAGISIGDVSGHGLPAALLVRDVVIGLRMGLASEYKIVHTLKKLNKVIQRSTYSSNFVSLFLAEIEKGGHLFYVNAGHPSPFIISGKQITDLKPTGIVLGFLENAELQRSYIHFECKSVLVLYTDGIIERQDAKGNEFGLTRLKKVVLENQQSEAKEIVEIIFKTVFEYDNSKKWDDDVTVVVVKRL
jgi:sigma-B regulation protein RsbU (phosphoserine phosphatase)